MTENLSWAERITAAWRSSFEGVLECGRLLVAAKSDLQHGEWFRLIDSELSSIEQRASGRFATPEAGAVLAYTLGALVLGAFAPQKTAGFAAPGFHRLVRGLLAD